MEWYINWIFIILSIISVFFWLPKQPIKDWLIIFYFMGFLSGFIDSFVVAYNLIQYPIRFLPNIFEINILFDLLVFPTLCVIFNQTTYHSKYSVIIGQSILYSTLMTLFEYWVEKNTQLIVYYKWWTWTHTFGSLLLTFLIVRGTVGIIRKYSY